MTAAPPRSIADRLAAVDSRETLHELLGELADTAARWTRTQVRAYLPRAWRSIADAYFDGERLRPRGEFPPSPASFVAPSLAEAVAAFRARGAASGAGEATDDADPPATDGALPPRTPALSELLATPEPVGDEPVAQMLRALREEMRVADATQPKRFRLTRGRCVRGSEGRFVYQFNLSSEPDPHVPGEIRVDGRWYPARVGESVPDEGTPRFELTADTWLGADVESAVFRVDPTFLLRKAYEAIQQRDAQSPDAGIWAARLLATPEAVDGGGNRVSIPLRGLNERQREAVRVAASAPRSYVWGPPGTGKTTTVGTFVSGLAAAGRRVLVISPYNVAVDEAILAVARAGGRDGVVRLGRAGPEVRRQALDLESRLEECARASGLLHAAQRLAAALIARKPEEHVAPPSTVRGCLDELGALVVRRRGRRDDPDSVALNGAIAELREQFQEPRREIVNSARVVGCTMALSFVASDVHLRPYDHLVVDEASVVRSPEALLAVLQCGAPVTFFGDPQQLPPVVLADGPQAKRWLAPHPFAMAGISRPEDARGACVMLDEQHRMAPPIRTIVSELFYAGRLRDGEHAPRSGHVLIVDTARSGARSTPKRVKLSNSKENTLHRGIVAEVLRCIGKREPAAKALVLSPFVAQKRAYRRERATAEALRNVRFETIHTSQGTEQDVVILDLVLAGSGAGTRSRMLDGRANEHLANLLNVAISRTRRTLVIVGDLSLVRREYRGGLLDRLVGRAAALGRSVEVEPRLAGLRAALDDALAPRV